LCIALDAIGLSDDYTCHKNWFGNAAVIQPAGAHPPFLPTSPGRLPSDVTIGNFFLVPRLANNDGLQPSIILSYKMKSFVRQY
jgi:hypothetical protein